MTQTVSNPTIMVVFGTRPEEIKLFPVINALRQEGKSRVLVCVTAQHRGLLDQVLELADITPDIEWLLKLLCLIEREPALINTLRGILA